MEICLNNQTKSRFAATESHLMTFPEFHQNENKSLSKHMNFNQHMPQKCKK